MMETIEMETDVVVNVKRKRNGSAVVVHQINPVNVKNMFLIKFNSQ